MTKRRASTWGEEISLEYGKALRGYGEAKGPVPVYGTNGPVGWTDAPLAPGPGVILGRKGAYRGVHFSSDPFFVIDTAYYAVPKTKLDMRWLYYAMIHHKLGEIDDGSPIPSTTRSAVYPRELEVPEIDEQRAMAAVLGSLDDKIELNRKMNETLEAMARAIFKSWFVDFDPVRAKMEGRKPYLPQEIWSLFPDHLGEDGSPSGWSEKPLTHFFEIVGGGTPKTSEASYWGGDVPWFSVVDTPSGADTYVIDTEKTITAEGLQNSSAQLIEAGATIVSARGTVGNLARTGRPMAFNQSCYGLRGANGYGPSFVFLTARHMVSKLQSLAHGSVFSTITRQTFEAISLFAPSNELADRFEMASGPLFDGILANVQESRTLSAIRDLLLPKLMSGEVRIKDAEKLVGEAGV